MEDNLSKSERLLFSTVRLVFDLPKGGEKIGTGFYFQYKSNKYIITNRHVVEDSKSLRMTVHVSGSSLATPKLRYLSINYSGSDWITPDSDIDLCAMPVSVIEDNLEGEGLYAHYITDNEIPSNEDLSNLSALEDVFMAGYPEGLWDEENNFPLIRKGITATHPIVDYNGDPTTVIDIATFNGNSGSPVVIINEWNYTDKYGSGVGGGRYFLLGVLFEGPETTFQSEIKNIEASESPKENGQNILEYQQVMHLGYIVKSREIISLVNGRLSK